MKRTTLLASILLLLVLFVLGLAIGLAVGSAAAAAADHAPTVAAFSVVPTGDSRVIITWQADGDVTLQRRRAGEPEPLPPLVPPAFGPGAHTLTIPPRTGSIDADWWYQSGDRWRLTWWDGVQPARVLTPWTPATWVVWLPAFGG